MDYAVRQARWVGDCRLRGDTAVRLFCLPFAGGGALAYRGWAELLPAGVELVPLHLPGREGRLREPALNRAEALVDELCDALLPVFRQRPFAIYGHSMGAAVAFELARRLEGEGLDMQQLFVAARRAPHLRPPPGERPLHELDDVGLRRTLERLGGTPAMVLADPELMALILPTLRADLAVSERYCHAAQPALRCRVTSFAGIDDRQVPPEDVAQWQATTRGAFAHHPIAGGHFFLQTARDALLRVITREIAIWAPRP